MSGESVKPSSWANFTAREAKASERLRLTNVARHQATFPESCEVEFRVSAFPCFPRNVHRMAYWAT